MTAMDDKLAEIVAERLRVVGQPMRVRLITCLRSGEASVQELTKALGAVQQNVSQHLAILHKAGVLDRHKVGTRVYYELGDATAIAMLDAATAGLAQRSRELADLTAGLEE
jgi:DNA-binding transcriptional ArsR family regulator